MAGLDLAGLDMVQTGALDGIDGIVGAVGVGIILGYGMEASVGDGITMVGTMAFIVIISWHLIEVEEAL